MLMLDRILLDETGCFYAAALDLSTRASPLEKSL
jgi:hypothetical protein